MEKNNVASKFPLVDVEMHYSKSKCCYSGLTRLQVELDTMLMGDLRSKNSKTTEKRRQGVIMSRQGLIQHIFGWVKTKMVSTLHF